MIVLTDGKDASIAYCLTTALGVPADLQSAVKNVRPMKPGDLQSPLNL